MSWRATSRSVRRTRSRAAGVLASTAVAAALALAGCGSGEEASAEPERPDEVVDISGTEPVGEMTAGSVAQLVECKDWNEADEAERLATIADVRSQHNLEDGGVESPALTDEEAAAVFDNACEAPHAQGFRLYLLYARAASFAPLARELER